MAKINWNGKVVVETASGAVYQFEVPDKDGWRDITRNGFPFGRGRVVGLADPHGLGVTVYKGKDPVVGRAIAIETKDHGPERPWCTTVVRAIRQA